MKHIAFIGQMMYFKCSIPRSLPGYKIHEVNVNFEPSDPSRFFPCLELEDKQHIDVWIFFRGEFAPEQVLEQLTGTKVWVSTEPLGREDVRKMFCGGDRFFFTEHRKYFDYMTHYDPTEIEEIRANGFEVDFCFPLPVDTDTYKPNPKVKKRWDLVFMGRSCNRRAGLTGSLKKDFEFLSIDNGVYGTEAVRLYQMSKIGVNLHVGNFPQFQHRVMNMMACGLPILSDELSNTGWISEDNAKYFNFIANNDGRKMYNEFLAMMENTYLPLEKKGAIMRKLAVRHFDARTNWLQLLNKMEMKQ